MRCLKTLAVWGCGVLLCSCSASDGETVSNPEGAQTPLAACTADDIKQWAYNSLNDYYLFYDQVAVVNPRNYDSAASLVEAVRVLPYDRYSRVVEASIEEEVYVEGKRFGIGAFWIWDVAGDLRLAGVYADSPLGRAGAKRGDILVAINQTPVENLTVEMYDAAVGTRDQPRAADWTIQDASGQRRTFNLTPAFFDINTVMHSETLTLPNYSEKVGYLVLDGFLGVSEAELDNAIAGFREDNIGELILDLRYNGGGLISVATKLASQIAGPATDEQLMIEYRHNDKYTEFDFALDFEAVDGSLGLERLLVLTTDYTASASELVINALSPYIDVVTIGTRTTGKPYISLGNDFCGQRLHALQAEGFNASDVSVYGGIAPSCGSVDDLTRDFGSTEEGMLSDALNYLTDGACNTPELAAAPGLQNDSPLNNPLIDLFSKPELETGALLDQDTAQRRRSD
jgi:C-terminal processing protease CtpA/Prc